MLFDAFDNTFLGFIEVSPSGNVVLWNGQCHQLTFSIPQLLGMCYWVVCPD